MRFPNFAGGIGSRVSLVSALALGVALSPVAVSAFVPVPGPGSIPGPGPAPGPLPPPSAGNPIPRLHFGPTLPYISGRLGGAQQGPTDAPTGNVVPDDFCLPGKFTDCGEHLRANQDAEPFSDNGPVFSDAGEFGLKQARNSGWVSAQSRQTSQTALGQTQTARAISIGGDRRFGEKFVVGVMVTSIDTTLSYNLSNITDNSSGFLVGPYIAYQLSDNWTVDARYITGNSSHIINTAGVQTGSFSGAETFTALRLSGAYGKGKWRLHPSLEFSNSTENQDAYVDGTRGAIASASTSDSYATASILAYYDGVISISPYFGLETSQALSGGGSSFGTLRAGVSKTFDNGGSFNFDYAYGAIGLSNTDDRQISLRMEIPF